MNAVNATSLLNLGEGYSTPMIPATQRASVLNLPPDDAQPGGAQRPRSMGVSRWKRDMRLFALLMIVMVVAVAATSSALMWRLLREQAAAAHEGQSRIDAAATTRQLILEVDRLLLKSIALSDPDAVRAAAVASIAAASRMEDAVSALKQMLPESKDVERMAQLVEQVKPSRMRVIVHARKGDDEQAIATIASISEPLRSIDQLSVAVQQAQVEQRRLDAQAWERHVRRQIQLLLIGSIAGLAVAGLFYRRLMRQLARTGELEALLLDVNVAARRMDGDGAMLDGLNHDMRDCQARLAGIINGLQSAFQAMDAERRQAVDALGMIESACKQSMQTSMEQAGHASAVVEQIRGAAQQMHALRETSTHLSRNREQIVGFTETITRISSMTRLLSMNAAVEAARAGEAGKGFAVVSQSIRALSDQTQAAVLEISRASEEITLQVAATEKTVVHTQGLMVDCSQRMAILEQSAQRNHHLVDALAMELARFSVIFNTQAKRVQTMDADVSKLDESLQSGQAQVQLLSETAASLTGASSRMLTRLAAVTE